jgi:hypothetical protein
MGTSKRAASFVKRLFLYVYPPKTVDNLVEAVDNVWFLGKSRRNFCLPPEQLVTYMGGNGFEMPDMAVLRLSCPRSSPHHLLFDAGTPFSNPQEKVD